MKPIEMKMMSKLIQTALWLGVNDYSYENSTATYELASHPYDFKVRI